MDSLFITFRVADESVERRILGAMTKQYGIDENGMPKRLDKLPEGTESIFEKTQKTTFAPGSQAYRKNY